MERGKFVDIGTHEDLLRRNENYSTILSRKEGNNQKIDLDLTNNLSKSEFEQTDYENIVQDLIKDTKKKTSLRNSVSEVGYGSTESLISTSSISVSRAIDSEHHFETTVTGGIKYFLKVYYIPNLNFYNFFESCLIHNG